MTADYQVVLQDASGTTQEVFSAFTNLNYARSFNTMGTLTLTIPDWLTPGRVTRDWRILVYRSVDNAAPYLDGNTFFLVRKVEWDYDNHLWTINCEDSLSIINRRIVAYTPETTYADKTFLEFQTMSDPPIDLLTADDMIKEYARQNIGSDALDTTRDISDYITVQQDFSVCPVVEKQAGFANLLSTFQDIARMSDELGTPLYFDIVFAGSIPQLQTFTEYRGVNHGQTGSQTITFIPGMNLANVKMTWDYSEEITYVIAGGVGSGAGRMLWDKLDERANASPWNRNEYFLDAKDAMEDEGDFVEDQMDGILREGRPKLVLEADAVDAPGSTYGVDYFYGDLVTVQMGQYAVDCSVNAIGVSINESGEKLDIKLRGEISL